MSLPWVEKYRPSSRTDLVGNEIAINGLYLFLKNWSPQSKFPGALLIGPAGCGKTSAVQAIAQDLGYELIELNASDTRKKSSIINIVAPSAQYQSLDTAQTKRIILMDEVDGISGRHDRGGLNEFLKIIKSSAYPVVCTANDPESDKLNRLKRVLRVFEYQRLDEYEIFELLHAISENEMIQINDLALEQIASKAAGDIRAAINELESHAMGTQTVQLEERNKMITLSELFNQLYRSKNYQEARKVMNDAPSDYYKLLLFLYDITADQCKTPQEVARTYQQLAEADMVYNRIMRTQDWSLLKYFFAFIGPGLVLSRPSHYHKKITSLPNIPSSFISRGVAKRVRGKAMKVAPILSKKTHISKTRFVNEEFEYFSKILLSEDTEWARRGAEIAAWLGLDDDILEDLVKINSNSQLMDHIQDARRVVGRQFLEAVVLEEKPFALDTFITSSTKTPSSPEEVSDDTEVNQSDETLSLDDFF